MPTTTIPRRAPALRSTLHAALAGVALALSATAVAVAPHAAGAPSAFPPKTEVHRPLESRPARRPWVLCAVFPHIKDAYWLGVNFGMIDEARRLAVDVRFLEAGGYPNLERQRDHIRSCAADPEVNALIVGTVSFEGLSPLLQEVSQRIPVLAAVNDIADAGVAAKVGVNWYDMGRAAGDYLAKQAASARGPVPIAWFPGPQGAGWVPFVDRGFRDAIAGSGIVVAATAWGDTSKTVQRNLVQKTLDAQPGVRYLVGNALMAEAAVSVLRERGLQNRVGIVSTYFTPAVHRGIVRGRILAAPTDAPVLQGRLSIAQAVALLEQRPVARHLGPAVRIVDRSSLQRIDLGDSLPPNLFTPQFRYQPPPKR
ncbi:MAG: TMAO reductase system periplasmic protein TorT [Thauera sp.]|nr:TMAO reductase system periplasmic protein TorT [Thauera sp.]